MPFESIGYFGIDTPRPADIFSLVMTAVPMTHAEKRNRRKLMAQAVKSGTPVGEVARMFGVTVRLVQMACQEHGVKPPGSSAAAE